MATSNIVKVFTSPKLYHVPLLNSPQSISTKENELLRRYISRKKKIIRFNKRRGDFSSALAALYTGVGVVLRSMRVVDLNHAENYPLQEGLAHFTRQRGWCCGVRSRVGVFWLGLPLVKGEERGRKWFIVMGIT
jgi:hypothetical protein